MNWKQEVARTNEELLALYRTWTRALPYLRRQEDAYAVHSWLLEFQERTRHLAVAVWDLAEGESEDEGTVEPESVPRCS